MRAGVASSSLTMLALSLALGCGGASTPDAGPTDGGPPSDAGADAGGLDATPGDTGAPPADAGPRDGGADDTGTPPPDAGFDDAGTPATPRMRVVAANLTSGNGQDYDPGHGLRILEALSPDVVLIQEFNYFDDSERNLGAFTARACGAECVWYRAETGSLPNGVISRWPILESGTWVDDEVGNRGFSWARIDVPGPTDLWAVSLHLLTRNSSTRNREAEQLVGYIEAQVPAGDLLVVGGDLNTDTRREGALQTLSRVVRTDAVPADRNGNGDTNGSRNKPYDWVLPDADLEALEIPVVLAGQSFASGLVFDTRVFTPISAVPPASAADSDASQMQHMAVVRDFALPE